jgi:hypothetical protein
MMVDAPMPSEGRQRRRPASCFGACHGQAGADREQYGTDLKPGQTLRIGAGYLSGAITLLPWRDKKPAYGAAAAKVRRPRSACVPYRRVARAHSPPEQRSQRGQGLVHRLERIPAGQIYA